jgi:N-acylneuraminate cytidylyltransferase/CMP-N,N'-diacetyllegionaminic acid synthase
MYKEKRILGLITARGGSKGLPKKNILHLLGKPLIAWTIEQARDSKYVDNIVVSTDSEEIAIISKEYGAQVPFIRPEHLASDEAKSVDVVLHALDWFETQKDPYDLLVLLQPTSPLRLAEDIDKTIELLFYKNAQSVVSVCETELHPYYMNVLPDDGCMKDFLRSEVLNKSRQELPHYYRLNGAIYLTTASYLKKQGSFFGDEVFAYIMPKERSIDIDTELDMKICEHLLLDNIRTSK